MSRGLCRRDYQRLMRHGDPTYQRPSLRDRLVRRTEIATGCWAWTGARDSEGYGVVKVGGKLRRAHRVAYELQYGSIPDGLVVMHRCDNPSCVNPAHLTAGTQRANVRDALAKDRRPQNLIRVAA